MSLISHSNGFTTKEPKKRVTCKFAFKAIGVLVLFSIIIGITANSIIASKNEKKFVKNNKYVTIDNKKNYYSVEGIEKPTIIFESSSGMGISQWDSTRKLLLDEFGIKSFAYDRDGFGFSDFTNPQSPEDQAKELKLILRKVALTGPYILVGEDYGSLVMTNFAKLYPELVEGIILISPINEKELGNNNYYKNFSKEKIPSKLNITGSYFGINNLIDKLIGLNSPQGLDTLLSEQEYNNYKMLRPTTKFNKAYYAELENILNKTSKSQTDGMFSNIPYVIITNNKLKQEQENLKSLGSPEKTMVISGNSDSKVISLEKPELILQSVDYIMKNTTLKENSNS